MKVSFFIMEDLLFRLRVACLNLYQGEHLPYRLWLHNLYWGMRHSDKRKLEAERLDFVFFGYSRLDMLDSFNLLAEKGWDRKFLAGIKPPTTGPAFLELVAVARHFHDTAEQYAQWLMTAPDAYTLTTLQNDD